MFITQPHLQPHRQITIQQPTNTDNHNRGVPKHITQAIGTTLFSSHQIAIALVLAYLERVTTLFQPASHRGDELAGILIIMNLKTIGKRPPPSTADVFPKVTELAQHLWGITNQTQGGRHHQKAHRGQKPPAVIDIPDGKNIKPPHPEQTKLVDISIGQLVLRQYSDNNACNTDKNQQAKLKTH